MKDILQSQNSSIPLQGLFCYPYGIYVYPVPPPYIQACQLFQEAGEQIIKQEVKEEYESESIQEVRKKKIVKFSPYIYPGETKNYYKNIGKKLSSFIINRPIYNLICKNPKPKLQPDAFLEIIQIKAGQEDCQKIFWKFFVVFQIHSTKQN
ncbi:unnamed protein product (macronuclear) [Paramecium tetraurelia]|uniref:Uncharacterized protein n=1 Tax=Paramecium tetraurelia TaxID=5888 RepID=A0CJM2_PARTE|nr:uncharacterized protein GSPATT00000701001 [Paramecium tetraurelia]CAK70989.1 unnamed protein product [Paramecium tetraurelia]|eukprot:XP_001438386.1 hypothetical protein (macronuclear) [Paramecium tetraurelia strain d4-2]